MESNLHSALQRAISHHENGNLQAAADIYQAIIEANPRHADAYHLLGVAAYHSGDAETALKLINTAISLDSSQTIFYSNKGEILLNTGVLEQAVQMYQKALQISPKDIKSLFNLGAIFLKLERLQEAKEQYKKLLVLKPGYADAHLNLGIIYTSCGQLQKAINCFNLAIRYKPDFQEAYQNIACCLFEAEKFYEAEENMRHAIELKKENHPSMYQMFSEILINVEKTREALHYFNLASKNLPDSSTYTFTIVQDTCLNTVKATAGKPYCQELKNVLIETMYWSIIDGNKYYCREITNTGYFHSELIEFHSKDKKSFLFKLPEPKYIIEEPCILIGGKLNYFHMLIDHFSRLAILEDYPELNNIPLLIHNREMPAFYQECLKILQIDPARLIKVPPATVIYCKNVIVPTMLSNNDAHFKIAVNWIRKKFMPKNLADKQEGNRLIYIPRSRENKKRLTSEDELTKALQNLGFEIIFPQDYSLKEQIEIFSGAKMIVGPHGTGLTNIIWAPQSAKIIDIKGEFNNFTYIHDLAQTRSMDYLKISGTSFIPPSSTLWEKQNADFYVTPQIILKSIRKILDQLN
jgi:tetratricopeptide (TPR) repeat protein